MFLLIGMMIIIGVLKQTGLFGTGHLAAKRAWIASSTCGVMPRARCPPRFQVTSLAPGSAGEGNGALYGFWS